jgi:AhpD family alkylhydroperoxidase
MGLSQEARDFSCHLSREAPAESDDPLRSSRDLEAESQAILDNVNQAIGFVPNLQRLMSLSPNALAGWAGLMGSLAKTLDVKTRDGIALAVSEADGWDYCLAAHSYIVGNLAKIPPEEIARNRQGLSSDPKRQAAIAFAKCADREARRASLSTSRRLTSVAATS